MAQPPNDQDQGPYGPLTPNEIMNQRELSRAMGQENISPTNEPFLGMIDNNIINMIKTVATRMIQVQGGGVGYEVIHPDLLSFIMSLGHLARTTNLDKTESKTAYFKFRQLVRISKGIHSGDLAIQDVLGKIELEGYVLYTGDAQEGRRQRYLSTQNRNVTINQPQAQAKKSWWSK